MFTDEITIKVRAGAGGNGSESFHHRSDHKRIPNGGDGADGGDVILRADPFTGSLVPLKARAVFEAPRGGAGHGGGKYGRKGEDLIVKVPCGTTVYDATDRLLVRDLVNPGDEVIVAKGGHGGYGNHSGRPATFGKPGKELDLLLSFKIIADIFLVGLPNAGKTTLLKRLTGAAVTESDYPFGTKVPQLGTYGTIDKQFSICEIPSIYKASGEGRGLGTHYLKHLERARLIFFMLSPETDFAADLKEGYEIVLKTIEAYEKDLLQIPYFFVVNKMDLVKKKTELKKQLPAKEKVFYISALTGDGVEQLMKQAAKTLEETIKCVKS